MIVSFDFDDTICIWSKVNNSYWLNKEIYKKILTAKLEGAKVYLITARSDTAENRTFINFFLKENNLSDVFDKIILVGTYKAETLKIEKVKLHYDDNDQELALAKLVGINVIKV